MRVSPALKVGILAVGVCALVSSVSILSYKKLGVFREVTVTAKSRFQDTVDRAVGDFTFNGAVPQQDLPTPPPEDVPLPAPPPESQALEFHEQATPPPPRRSQASIKAAQSMRAQSGVRATSGDRHQPLLSKATSSKKKKKSTSLEAATIKKTTAAATEVAASASPNKVVTNETAVEPSATTGPPALPLEATSPAAPVLPSEAQLELNKVSSSVETVSRTPHLDCDTSQPVEPRKRFLVTVYVDRGQPHAGEKSTTVQFVPEKPDAKEFQLTVYLLVSQQLKLDGPDDWKTLTIRLDEDTSEKITFPIYVEETGDGLPGVITALFYYQGYPCGSVRRKVRIGASKGHATAETESNSQESGSPPTVAPSVGALSIVPDGPDMTVTVIQTDDYPRSRYQCFVQAPRADPRNSNVVPWIPKFNTKDYLRTEFAILGKAMSEDKARADLIGNGIELFTRAPDIFKDVFWQLIDKNQRPRSILLFSDEPHLPWELMIPNEPPRRKRLEPLGVMSAFGRWSADDQLALLSSPPRHIALQKSLVWAPVYSPRLPTSEKEWNFLRDNMNGDIIKPGTFTGLCNTLEKTDATLLHLICHGSSDRNQPGDQTIRGENEGGGKNEFITVKQLLGCDNVASFCSRHPLIFLNACEAGETIETLTGAGGFAPQFIHLQAGAVVAPLWTVFDETAEQVAEEFYKGIREQPMTPFAERLRQIRARAYLQDPPPPGLATYAAYCFYGDPLATPASTNTTP